MGHRFFIAALWLLAAEFAAAAPEVLAVDIGGIIHPITAEIVAHAIAQASHEKAALVLLRLNTPGGLLDATREISQEIVASPVPVAAYVTPSGGRAASAGFFILESADVAAMAPGTNTGASSPVLLGEKMDPVMRNKIENDTSAWLRSVVTKRGRNADLAEKTVREAKAFTEREALDGHLIDLIAPDQTGLLAQLDGREVVRFDGKKQTLHLAGAEVSVYQKTIRETIISAIADPNIGFILLVLGALGIYVEFTAPGLIAPGVIGGILALLGLSSLSVLPINWTGAALLLLALACFVLEAKFTSHGILGAGGAVSMILGALLLINGPPSMRIHLSTAISVTLPFAVITTFLVSLVVRARRTKVVTGDSGLLDEVGIAWTALAPDGKIFVHGEYWDATASSPVPTGARVRVVGVDGLRLRVEAAGETLPPAHDRAPS